MAYHGILIPEAIAATNVDSFNRSVVVASFDVDNGFVVELGGKSTTAGETEVFSASAASGSSLVSLWMAYQGDEVVITDARYKGLDPDPRNFFVPAGKVFSAFKPQLGDIILITAAGLSGSQPTASYTHVNGTINTPKLTWGTSKTADVLSFKYLATKYISLATGTLADTQRVVAYEFECVGV